MSRFEATVLFGDPRLPYPYREDDRFGPAELHTIEDLRSSLGSLPGYRFTFEDDHERLLGQWPHRPPPFVVNLCDTGFRNRMTRKHHVAALLEMLEVPFTGPSALGMALCRDKYVVGAVARELGMSVPRTVLLRLDGDELLLPDFYPALIKPNRSGGSFGITTGAVVADDREARAYMRHLRGQLAWPEVLVQEYLPGPEQVVALVGNPEGELTALPPLQIDFGDLDPPIMSYEAKNDPSSPYWTTVRFHPAAPSGGLERAVHGCRLLFERLACRDCARFDFRCDAEGEPKLLDVNAHPMFAGDGMITAMAEWAGWSHPELLRRVIEAARARFAPS